MIRPRRLLLIASMLVCALPVIAEVTTGALTGKTTIAGEALPGVTITASSDAMQGMRVTVSHENGSYNLAALPPGDYVVRFEMEGLSPRTVNAHVSLGQTERLDLALEPPSMKEAITVVADEGGVPEASQVQTNFGARVIDTLPVRRTLQDITLLAPGAINFWPGETDNIVISGAQYYDSLYLVDGAVTTDNINGQTENFIIEDAIQETTVITAAISAEYGRFTGGVVSVITRSGGNEYSGSFRDSLTNPAWTSRSAFGEPNAESTLDETYEATLGGRIVRDRLWFFLAGRSAERHSQEFYVASLTPRPVSAMTDRRFESKVTAHLTERHGVVASWVDYDVEQTNVCGEMWGCWDEASLDPRQTMPRHLGSAHYNGIVTSNVLAEVGYSTRSLKIDHRGGNDPSEVRGTWGRENNIEFGGIFGAPASCGFCEPERRINDYLNAKLSWYVATTAAGSHNIVGGYEDFLEQRFLSDHRSASDFGIIISNVSPERDDGFNVLPTITGKGASALNVGDSIAYYPILDPGQGSRLRSDALFLNDRWDVDRRLSFNIGLRYDRNNGHDSSGNLVVNDRKLSPRLGVMYDLKGDGRLRLNASFSEYVARTWEAEIGRLGSGGAAATYLYEYRGPTVSGLPVEEAFAQVFDWFHAQGGVNASQLITSASVPGYTTRVDGILRSPYTREYTLGLGLQLGAKGYLRLDYIDRDWRDFYTDRNEPGLFSEPDPSGNVYDLSLLTNTNDLERTYKAVAVQGSYRFTDRVSIGGNYTWSRAWGNYLDDDALWAGDVHPFTYPEYKAYPQFLPSGHLPNEREHVARLWLAFDRPLGRLGHVNFSALERLDSGFPLAAVSMIPIEQWVENPGYKTPPQWTVYYFSDIGEYRHETATATDLGINYELPLGALTLFGQAEIINLFNEQARILGWANVTFLKAFNPFTDVPKECPQGQEDCTGYNYQKTPTFLEAQGPEHYQLPRTYRFSLGLRF